MTIEMRFEKLNNILKENYGRFRLIYPTKLQVSPETTDEQDQIVATIFNRESDNLDAETTEALLSNLAAQGKLESGEYVISY